MKVGLFTASGESVTSEAVAVAPGKDLCREGITGFRKLHKIGFGTYGSIYLAIHRTTRSSLFALKKFKFPEDKIEYGLPRSAVREIRLLKELQHENIVDCHGVLVSSGKGSIYMVLGFVEHDLVGILELWKRKLTVPEVKAITLQMLTAIDFCHIRGVVHRDLKCANFLVSKNGVIKLADFGLAREFSPDPYFGAHAELHLTSKVITLWYRPPELLLGATSYGPEIDMWSMGASIAELLLQRPAFSADKEIGVFGMIVEELGTPVRTRHEAAMKNLPLWKEYVSAVPGITSLTTCKIEVALSQTVSRTAWDLVGKMLSYTPSERISAAASREHEFFAESPVACLPEEIRVPRDDFCHGMSMKQKRERGDDPTGPSKKMKH